MNWLPSWSEGAVTSDPATPPTPDPPTPAAPREESVTGHPERRRILAIVACWPIPWREVWGRRANGLAESGVTWPDDELQAYDRTRTDRTAGLDPDAILDDLDPTRNRKDEPCPATPRPRSLFTT